MTMPDERRNAVNRTREFLFHLLRDVNTPEDIRKEAAGCLRHYPGEYYMDKAKEQAPEVFGDWDYFYVKEEDDNE